MAKKPRNKDVNRAIKSGASANPAKPFTIAQLRASVGRIARKEGLNDSGDIERAVYDGMQDLRADKSK